MSKDFLSGMHSEEGGKTIIVLGKDDGIRSDIAKFLSGMHPEDGGLKILGTHDELLERLEQANLNDFLRGMHPEDFRSSAKKVKKKVSEILD